MMEVMNVKGLRFAVQIAHITTAPWFLANYFAIIIEYFVKRYIPNFK